MPGQRVLVLVVASVHRQISVLLVRLWVREVLMELPRCPEDRQALQVYEHVRDPDQARAQIVAWVRVLGAWSIQATTALLHSLPISS